MVDFWGMNPHMTGTGWECEKYEWGANLRVAYLQEFRS